ncbi:MAG: DUF1847 domain-containing protein [Deltaproteobacteria bacterium]|nr:DUF1847 domain-containing protein [Deltaproteobacteria bacterium]MBW2068058.1 DUF1847 domain-containing protein [Deltaproteobacteria bacterium]
MKQKPDCANCHVETAKRICRTEDGIHPKYCPTVAKKDLIERSIEEYRKKDVLHLAYNASLQEAQGYGNREKGYERVVPIKPRILEVAEFAHKMGFKKLGIAFCIGLRKEAKTVAKFFTDNSFEVVSVVCKVGRVPKETIGIKDDEKISIGNFESMCNPILQAMILNSESTDLNILLGLCVGHDTLFLKYAESPCTVLAVKDRVLGHNPLAAVYNIDSYYRYLKRLSY